MNPPDDICIQLAVEIYHRTQAVVSGQTEADSLPTAADLARVFGLKLDKAKKRIQSLRLDGLVQPIGMSPKRYRFDTFWLRDLTEESPWYEPLQTALAERTGPLNPWEETPDWQMDWLAWEAAPHASHVAD